MINRKVIVCPSCGAEYLPAEIYMPKSFLGQPYNIIKNSNGKIISYYGHNILEDESYICDYCNKEFNVKSDMTFSTEVGISDFFENDYIRPINKPFILKEN